MDSLRPPHGRSAAQATAAVYDQLAAGYEAGFFENAIASSARDRSRALYANWLKPDDRVADLGCGPGIDTVWLAERTASVVAVDCSPEMIRQLRQTAAGSAVRKRISAYTGDVFSSDGPLAELGDFDVLILGFGVLNYALDLRESLALLMRKLAPRGIIIASVLTRRSVWDLVWHWVLLHRKPARWSRRPSEFTLGDATCVERHWVLEDFKKAIPGGSDVVHWEAMGHFAPPPYANSILERVPALRRRVLRMDYATRRSVAARWGGDVLWVVIRAG